MVLQADPSKPVLVAGDPERAHEAKVKEEGGITYHINQITDSVSILSFTTTLLTLNNSSLLEVLLIIM